MERIEMRGQIPADLPTCQFDSDCTNLGEVRCGLVDHVTAADLEKWGIPPVNPYPDPDIQHLYGPSTTIVRSVLVCPAHVDAFYEEHPAGHHVGAGCPVDEWPITDEEVAQLRSLYGVPDEVPADDHEWRLNWSRGYFGTSLDLGKQFDFPNDNWLDFSLQISNEGCCIALHGDIGHHDLSGTFLDVVDSYEAAMETLARRLMGTDASD